MYTEAVLHRKVVGKEVVRFVEQHVDNPVKLEILFFWSRHPKAKFTLRTIVHILNRIRAWEIERNLEALAQSGLVRTYIQPSGGVFYGLEVVCDIQKHMLELAKCSWYELRCCFCMPEPRVYESSGKS